MVRDGRTGVVRLVPGSEGRGGLALVSVGVLLDAVLVADFEGLVLVVVVAAPLVAVESAFEPGALVAQAVEVVRLAVTSGRVDLAALGALWMQGQVKLMRGMKDSGS